MNIFEYVQQMEKDGEAFYRDIADHTADKGLKTILIGLAEDEVKHYNIFKELEKKASPEYTATPILTNAKNVFTEMRTNKEDASFPGDHVDAYRKALDVELKSEAFYKEKAEEVEEAYAKELFLKIAAEEKKHAHLLEHIIEFITKPDTWLESAEFRNLDDF
jgi:rubrerythrin